MSNIFVTNNKFENTTSTTYDNWDCFYGKLHPSNRTVDTNAVGKFTVADSKIKRTSSKTAILFQPLSGLVRNMEYAFVIKKNNAPISARLLRKNTSNNKYFYPKTGITLKSLNGQTQNKRNFNGEIDLGKIEDSLFTFSVGAGTFDADNKTDDYAIELIFNNKRVEVEYTSMYAGKTFRAETTLTTTTVDCLDIDNAPNIRVRGVSGISAYNSDENYFYYGFNNYVNGLYVPEEWQNHLKNNETQIRWKHTEGLKFADYNLGSTQTVYTYIQKNADDQWEICYYGYMELKVTSMNTPDCPFDATDYTISLNPFTDEPNFTNLSIEMTEEEYVEEGSSGSSGESNVDYFYISGDYSSVYYDSQTGYVDFNGRYRRRVDGNGNNFYKHTQNAKIQIHKRPNNNTWILGFYPNGENNLNFNTSENSPRYLHHWILPYSESEIELTTYKHNQDSAKWLKSNGADNWGDSTGWQHSGDPIPPKKIKLSTQNISSSEGSQGSTGEQESSPDSIFVSQHPNHHVNGKYNKEPSTQLNGKPVYKKVASAFAYTEYVIAFMEGSWGFTIADGYGSSTTIQPPFHYGHARVFDTKDPTHDDLIYDMYLADDQGFRTGGAATIENADDESSLDSSVLAAIEQQENPVIKISQIWGDYTAVYVSLDETGGGYEKWGFEVHLMQDSTLDELKADIYLEPITQTYEQTTDNKTYVHFDQKAYLMLKSQIFSEANGGAIFGSVSTDIAIKVIGYSNGSEVCSTWDTYSCSVETGLLEPDNINTSPEWVYVPPYEVDNAPSYLDVSCSFFVDDPANPGLKIADPTLNCLFVIEENYKNTEITRRVYSITQADVNQYHGAPYGITAEMFFDGHHFIYGQQTGFSHINYPRPVYSNKQDGNKRRYILWHPSFMTWIITGPKKHNDILFVPEKFHPDSMDAPYESGYLRGSYGADLIAPHSFTLTDARREELKQMHTSEEGVLDADAFAASVAMETEYSPIAQDSWPNQDWGYVHADSYEQWVRNSNEAKTKFREFRYKLPKIGIKTQEVKEYYEELADIWDVDSEDAGEDNQIPTYDIKDTQGAFPAVVIVNAVQGSAISDLPPAPHGEVLVNYNFYKKQLSPLNQWATGYYDSVDDVSVIKGWTVLVGNNHQHDEIEHPEMAFVKDDNPSLNNIKEAEHLFFDDFNNKLVPDPNTHDSTNYPSLNHNLGTNSTPDTYIDWRHLHRDNKFNENIKTLREEGCITYEADTKHAFVTPLLKESAFEDSYSSEYASCEYLKRSAFEDSNANANRSLLRNTKYTIRVGSWRDTRRVRIRFYRFDKTELIFKECQVTWLDIDGEDLSLNPSKGKTNQAQFIVNEGTFKTNAGILMQPVLMLAIPQHSDIISSISIAPTESMVVKKANPVKKITNPNPSATKKVAALSTTNPKSIKSVSPANLKVNKILPKDKYKDLLIRESFADLELKQKYKFEITNPSPNAYPISFGYNNSFSSPIRILSIDGVVQNGTKGVWKKSFSMKKEVVFFRGKEEVNCVDVRVGGELLLNGNLKDIDNDKIVGMYWGEMQSDNKTINLVPTKKLDFTQSVTNKSGKVLNMNNYTPKFDGRRCKMSTTFRDARLALKTSTHPSFLSAKNKTFDAFFDVSSDLVDGLGYRVELITNESTKPKKYFIQLLDEDLKPVKYDLVMNRGTASSEVDQTKTEFVKQGTYEKRGFNDSEASNSIIVKFNSAAETVKYIRISHNSKGLVDLQKVSITMVTDTPSLPANSTLYGGFSIIKES